MPINGISVGKDIIIVLNDNNGNVVTNRVKSFVSKQKTSNRETIALDGINRHLNIPTGWEGSFEMERTSSIIDQFIYNIEQAYDSGATVPLISITETITETDGSISQYLYQGCVIQLDSAGEWKGDDLVTQKINFMASSRQALA